MPKDACYHKVKSRYRVFPSAYASGAIAKCRKVGAANYGNSSKKKKAAGGVVKLGGGGLARRKRPSSNPNIARGCGIVQENRRKVTKYV